MNNRVPALTPENGLFILVSFEGPDRYSQADGLAVRVTGLAETLARLGYETHLVYVGDPALPGEEHPARAPAHSPSLGSVGVADGRVGLHSR